MNGDEMLEFYAKAYNTIQEIVWTEINEGLETKCFWLLDRFLEDLDKHIEDNFTKEQREQFIERTDHIRDRIYFNI